MSLKPMQQTSNALKGASTATAKTAIDARILQSCDLFDGSKALVIVHCGERYCLRQTKNNKLILTK